MLKKSESVYESRIIILFIGSEGEGEEEKHDTKKDRAVL